MVQEEVAYVRSLLGPRCWFVGHGGDLIGLYDRPVLSREREPR